MFLTGRTFPVESNKKRQNIYNFDINYIVSMCRGWEGVRGTTLSMRLGRGHEMRDILGKRGIF